MDDPVSALSWSRALDFTLRYEGGYVNAANDRGGETFRGISRRFWPAWGGWAAVDLAKAASPNAYPSLLLADKGLMDLAVDFYKTEFWEKIHGDELPGKVAVAAFDMAGHSGAKTAVRSLQAALGDLVVDGEVGSKTIKRAYDRDEEGLEDYMAERARFLHQIMVDDDTQRAWARNWFRRLFKLANVVLEGPGVEFVDDPEAHRFQGPTV